MYVRMHACVYMCVCVFIYIGSERICTGWKRHRRGELRNIRDMTHVYHIYHIGDMTHVYHIYDIGDMTHVYHIYNIGDMTHVYTYHIYIRDMTHVSIGSERIYTGSKQHPRGKAYTWHTWVMSLIYDIQESCPLYMTYMSHVPYIWHTWVTPLIYEIHESCPLYMTYMSHIPYIWHTWVISLIYHIRESCLI